MSGVDLCLCVLAAPSPCWLKGDASFLGNKEEALKVNMSVRAKFYTVSLCKLDGTRDRLTVSRRDARLEDSGFGSTGE